MPPEESPVFGDLITGGEHFVGCGDVRTIDYGVYAVLVDHILGDHLRCLAANVVDLVLDLGQYCDFLQETHIRGFFY